MSGHLERLEALLAHKPRVLTFDEEADLRAALDELKQLRAEREGLASLAGDYLSHLEMFCAEWLKQNQGSNLIDHGFGPEHGGELTTHKILAAVNEVNGLRDEVGRVTGDLLRTLGERDAHRRRQIEAERTLIVMLAREGGSAEFTPAELTAANYNGSFVSSRDVANGNERLGFVTAKSPTAPQQPERGGEATCNPECREAHAGQPH